MLIVDQFPFTCFTHAQHVLSVCIAVLNVFADVQHALVVVHVRPMSESFPCVVVVLHVLFNSFAYIKHASSVVHFLLFKLLV